MKRDVELQIYDLVEIKQGITPNESVKPINHLQFHKKAISCLAWFKQAEPLLLASGSNDHTVLVRFLFNF